MDNPVTEKTKAMISAITAKQSLIIILVVAAMFVLVLVVLYIIQMVQKTSMDNVLLHDKVIALNNRDVPIEITDSKMGTSSNGRDFSYSFWLYLNDLYEPTANHKLIFQRGDQEVMLNKYSHHSNPIVFMDRMTNRLFVAMSTTEIKSPHTLDDVIRKDAEGKYVNPYLVSYIDYVPLQRWINVVVVSKENMMLLFLDGDLYSATAVTDIVSNDSPRPIIRSSTGTAVIGEKNGTLNALLSQSKYYNYALSQREVKAIYNTGPNKKSILSYIGLDRYGVRSPVYNIEDP